MKDRVALLLRKALIRLVLFTLARLRYPLRAQGLAHLPATGGVLLLGNHVSWLDWIVVQLLCPRPVHFVLPKAIYEHHWLHRLFRWFGCIPLAPEQATQTMAAAAALLQQGAVVCLFPEGVVNNSGRPGTFHRAWERAMAATTVPVAIVPFHLRGLWGSLLLRSTERIRLFARPELRREIVLAFGAPLPTGSSTDAVRTAILDLEYAAWQEYAQQLPTLGEQWIASARRHGNPVVLVDTLGTRLKARQALTGSIILARRFRRLSPEQNIGLLLPSSAGSVLANLACMLAGKTAVNLNFTASSAALLSSVLQAEVKTVYTSTRFLERLQARGVDIAPLQEYCTLVPLETFRASTSVAEKLLTLLSCFMLPTRWLQRMYCHRHPIGQTAVILFSSGSEGAPKGVQLSHRNLMANVKQVAEVLNMEADEVILANLPPFHAFGLTATHFLPLLEGIPVVCHADPTDVVATAQAVAAHRVTLMFGTSTFFRLYCRNAKVLPLMLQSLRLVVAGAEKLQDEVRQQFRERFGKDILEGYGATETAPVASVNLPDRLNPDTWQVETSGKTGSVGRAIPGTLFRIVDPDTFTALPTGSAGMILISGAQVMPHYLKNEAQTRKVLQDIDGKRWYVTGDKGYLDADGFLFIQDRYSRFAKISGEMVGLGSVEAELRKAIGDDEIELVVVNLPDERKGEKLVTLATRTLDPAQLRERLLAGGLNPLALPALYFTVEAIPKLGSGKTDFAGARQLGLELAAKHSG